MNKSSEQFELKYGTSLNGHSIFAPSSSAMWMECAGSLIPNVEHILKHGDSAGVEAAEGTVAHFVADMWNRTGVEPNHLIGSVQVAEAGGVEHKITVTQDMMAYIQLYVDWCAEVPGEHHYETRVDLSEIMPIKGQGGTADHFVCSLHKLVITDLKFGTGYRVYAKRNSQAMLYAAGVFLEYDWIYGFEEITIRICHPRLDVFDVWVCTRDEMLEFIEYAKGRALLCCEVNAPRTPSVKACQWCAVASDCPARLIELEELVDDSFVDMTTDEAIERAGDIRTFSVDDMAAANTRGGSYRTVAEMERRVQDRVVPEMSTATIAYILTKRKSFEKWFAALAQELLDRVERGQRAPFWELKDGRKTKKWRDPELARVYLEENLGLPEDRVSPVGLISVSGATELIRTVHEVKPKEAKAMIEDLFSEFAGRRTLAPDRDSRADVWEDAEDTFAADEDADGGGPL